MCRRLVRSIFSPILHLIGKVYNATGKWVGQLRKRLSKWGGTMAKKARKAPAPRRKRVTFYIRPKGSKRRKKISFLARQ